MPLPTPVSAYTSTPVSLIRSNSEGDMHNDIPQLKNPKIRKSSDNIFTSLYRPTKRITSCTSLNNLSEPLFKNIKHYKSKKLRSVSSTALNSSPPPSPISGNKRLDSIITSEIPASSTRSSSGLFSTPSTPIRNPGLSFEDSPNSEYSPITPSHEYFTELRDDHVSRKLFRSNSQCTDDELGGKIELLDLDRKSSHHIFQIPEIVNLILQIYDVQHSYIPREEPPVRRVPLSYEHALLIHKDEKVADRVWRESRDFITNGSRVKAKHALFPCLTVNKLWYELSTDIMQQNCYFDDENNWLKYAFNVNKKLQENRILKPMKSPESFVLHKVTHVKQRHFDLVTSVNNYNRFKWLELYIVPNVLPNPKMFTNNLQKLVITGSKVLNDKFLISIAQSIPNIEVLDLRACELITDASIYSISLNCPKLRLLNVGRYTRGELISDASICSIVRNTKISTLGVAGCGISDRTIWELAIHRSHALERLSLNKCWRLTNESIPKTIKFFKKLSVLELRHCLQIDNVKPMIEYKRSQMSKRINVLIEGCETIEKLILQEEMEMDIEISGNVLADIAEWCNSNSDVE